jgi:hypothetical protein
LEDVALKYIFSAIEMLSVMNISPTVFQHLDCRSRLRVHGMDKIHIRCLNHCVLINNKAGRHGQHPEVIAAATAAVIMAAALAFHH